MLTKPTKKDQLRLKFDTSSNNLACFIQKREKSAEDSDANHEKQNRGPRKRAKSNWHKANNFRNKDFLESILTKTFTEEFADTDDIKTLVSNFEFTDEDDHFA
jgi:hypothetical protein